MTFEEQKRHIEKLAAQARADKRSAQYRHKQNLQHELALQHMEENIRLQMEGRSPMQNLSELKYGKRASIPETPPKATKPTLIQTAKAHPQPLWETEVQCEGRKSSYEEDGPMAIPN